jgi:effector-binding domain-containing protein
MKAAVAALLPLLACTSQDLPAARSGPAGVTSGVVIPAGHATRADANWKERLDQPYVFLEHEGDYRSLGEVMRRLFAAAAELELRPRGAPFALFYDDPGRVPAERLRARACLPVVERPGRLGDLRYDVLPRAMVVYALVRGSYPEVARSYPTLFAYLSELGWQPGGPVREVYLSDQSDVSSDGQRVTEVQIPWAARADSQ